MFAKAKLRLSFILLLWFVFLCDQAPALSGPWQTPSAANGQLQVTVTDQNGQPLGLVFVIVQQNDKTVAQERTTPSGNATVRQLAPGTYKLLLEKQGFYTGMVATLTVVAGHTSPVEVRLAAVRIQGGDRSHDAAFAD